MQFSKRDITAQAHTIDQCIRMLSSEILRITKLPYATKANRDKMVSIDKQIAYLEELLAAYERDLNKNI